jgi:hypothetical protein
MHRNTILVKAAFATALGIASVPLAGLTEARAQGSAAVDQPFPAYNPYPPGILPNDYSRNCSGFGAKLKPSKLAISQNGKH